MNERYLPVGALAVYFEYISCIIFIEHSNFLETMACARYNLPLLLVILILADYVSTARIKSLTYKYFIQIRTDIT